VFVRVHALGVNPPDWYLRDRYKPLPRLGEKSPQVKEGQPNPADIWKKWAGTVFGAVTDGGHLQPEDQPDQVLDALIAFLSVGTAKRICRHTVLIGVCRNSNWHTICKKFWCDLKFLVFVESVRDDGFRCSGRTNLGLSPVRPRMFSCPASIQPLFGLGLR
jgi:hypothetical protein